MCYGYAMLSQSHLLSLSIHYEEYDDKKISFHITIWSGYALQLRYLKTVSNRPVCRSDIFGDVSVIFLFAVEGFFCLSVTAHSSCEIKVFGTWCECIVLKLLSTLVYSWEGWAPIFWENALSLVWLINNFHLWWYTKWSILLLPNNCFLVQNFRIRNPHFHVQEPKCLCI